MRHSELTTRCPHCGQVNELQTHRNDKAPYAGALSICWLCTQVSIFVNGLFGLAVRMPTTEEAAEFAANPQVLAAQAAVRRSTTPARAAAQFPQPDR